MRLLLIAAPGTLGRALERALRDEGHDVDHVGSLDAGDACLRATRYDLVVIDLLRPEAQTLVGLGRWRQAGRSTPVLALVTPGDAGGPNLGADDYLAVPFGVEDLYDHVRTAAGPRDHLAMTPLSTPYPDPRGASAASLLTIRSRELNNAEPGESALLEGARR